MNYTYLLKHSNLFPAAIGISYQRFEQLLKKFSKELRKAEKDKAWSKKKTEIAWSWEKSYS